MPNQPQSPSAAVCRRAEVLNTVLAHHKRALQRQATRHATRPADADDALQDACVRFMRAYDGPPGTDALRWMLVVVKRCAWTIGEKHRRHETRCELSCTDATGDDGAVLVAMDDGPDPLHRAERAERQAASLAALALLKPDERTALLLFGLGYSYREIGQLRGWTHSKINRCLAEGRAALRDRDDGVGAVEGPQVATKSLAS